MVIYMIWILDLAKIGTENCNFHQDRSENHQCSDIFTR
jgi:hypothetical protein